VLFFFSSRRRHTRFKCDWSSEVCSSDLSQDLIVGYRDVAKKQERKNRPRGEQSPWRPSCRRRPLRADPGRKQNCLLFDGARGKRDDLMAATYRTPTRSS